MVLAAVAGDELAVRARLPSSNEETSTRLSNDQENDSAFKNDMVMAVRKRWGFSRGMDGSLSLSRIAAKLLS